MLYFADLVNKRIIDLEDPTIADLVDTTLIRRENLGAKFQNRFLDSPADRRPADGDGLGRLAAFGARPTSSSRASVQVSKAGQTYTPIGTLDAPRGSYTLKIGPVARDFTVDAGTVTLLRRPQRRRSTSRRATRCGPCGATRSR